MRKFKLLMLTLYMIILLYLIYQAYQAWQTPLFGVFIAIISLWTGGVLALGRIFTGLFHENQESGQKHKEKRQLHQKELIDTVIKPLYNHESVGFINEPLAMEHLRKGYPKIRKLWFKESKKLRSQISKDKKKIREYIKKKSENPLFSKLDNIYADKYMTQNEFGEIITYSNGDEISNYVNYYLRTSKLTKDEEYKEFVEAIINDKRLLILFENLYLNKNKMDANVYEFEQHLKKIAKDFDEWDVELKGICKECRHTYGIFKFLK